MDQITFADKIASVAKSGSVWLDTDRDNYAGAILLNIPASDGRKIFWAGEQLGLCSSSAY